jgi:hypothetical protein
LTSFEDIETITDHIDRLEKRQRETERSTRRDSER